MESDATIRPDVEKLKLWWCGLMHESVTWPRNGHYHCRTCGRNYAIPWARPEAIRVRVQAPFSPLEFHPKTGGIRVWMQSLRRTRLNASR